MQIIGKRGLSGILKHILSAFMLGGLAIMAGLPWILKWYFRYEYFNYYDMTPGDNEIFSAGIAGRHSTYYWTLLFLYLSGLLALMLIWQVRKLLIHVTNDRPFIPENVAILKKIGLICTIIAILYIPALFLIWSIFALVVFMVFAVVACFAFILAALFKKAMEYKDENDMTV